MVATLINNEFKTANYYTVEFNASNLSAELILFVQSRKHFGNKENGLVK